MSWTVKVTKANGDSYEARGHGKETHAEKTTRAEDKDKQKDK